MKSQVPLHDSRPGSAASVMARLVIVIMLCAFQYWLLAATMEAFHAGNARVALPAFLASVFCFALAVGLVITGEASSRRVLEDLEKS